MAVAGVDAAGSQRAMAMDDLDSFALGQSATALRCRVGQTR
jgi:hypothetical protein